MNPGTLVAIGAGLLAVGNYDKAKPLVAWLRSMRPSGSHAESESASWPSDTSAGAETLRYLRAMNEIPCADADFRTAVCGGTPPAKFMQSLLKEGGKAG